MCWGGPGPCVTLLGNFVRWLWQLLAGLGMLGTPGAGEHGGCSAPAQAGGTSRGMCLGQVELLNDPSLQHRPSECHQPLGGERPLSPAWGTSPRHPGVLPALPRAAGRDQHYQHHLVARTRTQHPHCPRQGALPRPGCTACRDGMGVSAPQGGGPAPALGAPSPQTHPAPGHNLWDPRLCWGLVGAQGTALPVGLAGTGGYMGSARGVTQLWLTPLCFDTSQGPVEPSGLELAAPLRGVPVSLLPARASTSTRCRRGLASGLRPHTWHRGATCPRHDGHLPGSLTALQAAAAPLPPHALRPRGHLPPFTPNHHGRGTRAVPPGPTGRPVQGGAAGEL